MNYSKQIRGDKLLTGVFEKALKCINELFQEAKSLESEINNIVKDETKDKDYKDYLIHEKKVKISEISADINEIGAQLFLDFTNEKNSNEESLKITNSDILEEIKRYCKKTLVINCANLIICVLFLLILLYKAQ